MDGASRWLNRGIAIVSVFALAYEFWAVASGDPTISRLIRNLAEAYHPVYWFGGIITGFLIIAELYLRLPTFIRLAVLSWIMVSAHIFWVLG